MIQATKPDPTAALQNLKMVFPHRAEAMEVALHEFNQTEKRLPVWRKDQVKALLKMTSLFAFDIEDRYQAQRGDQLATAVRNLTELVIWIEYCAISEKNARAFCDDGPRDMRELLEALQKGYTSANSTPEPQLAEMIAGLRTVAQTSNFPDIDKRYHDVRAAAREIGKVDAFGTLYKIFSKYTHPTALAIYMGYSPAILDALVVNGTQGALACFSELGKFVKSIYPEIDF